MFDDYYRFIAPKIPPLSCLIFPCRYGARTDQRPGDRTNAAVKLKQHLRKKRKMTLMKILKSFQNDEAGAVTVDWVVLTAAIVGLGIVVPLAAASKR